MAYRIGKDKQVASEGEEPVLTASGEVRKGRGLAESTFRKHLKACSLPESRKVSGALY